MIGQWDAVTSIYAKRYGLSRKQERLIAPYAEQLLLCKSEEAVRLLIGASVKFTGKELRAMRRNVERAQ